MFIDKSANPLEKVCSQLNNITNPLRKFHEQLAVINTPINKLMSWSKGIHMHPVIRDLEKTFKKLDEHFQGIRTFDEFKLDYIRHTGRIDRNQIESHLGGNAIKNQLHAHVEIDYKQKYFEEKRKGGASSNKKNKLLKSKVIELFNQEYQKDYTQSSMSICLKIAEVISIEHKQLLESFGPYIRRNVQGRDWRTSTFYQWCRKHKRRLLGK